MPYLTADRMSLADTEVPRILIADDEAPARARLRDLLDECRASFPLAIVDEARTGREALDVLNREKVDIVLLDIRMPEMDGMEAARHIAGMARAAGDHLHHRVRLLRASRPSR